MSVGPSNGSRSNGVSEQDAARRAAEEARRAAAEAARRAAEAARKSVEAQNQQAAEAARKSNTAFEGMPRNAQFDTRLGAEGPATSLLTEDAKDGQVNCLDAAADWVDKGTPQLRAKSEMVFLKDSRAGAEGQSGHVIVRQGDRILDPSTGKSFESMAAYQKAHPEYSEAGAVSATQAKKIFDAPAGSAERADALKQAKVSPELQQMMVADGDPMKQAQDAKASAAKLRARANELSAEAQRVPSGPNKEAAARAETKADEAEQAANDASLKAGLEVPFPRPLNIKSATQATEDYKRLKELHPEGQAHQTLELLKQHAGDPDYTAQLIDMARKGGDNGVLFHLGTRTFSVNASTQTPNAPEADRQVLLNALKTARDAGRLSDVDINSLRTAGGGLRSPWNDIAQGLGTPVVEHSSSANDVIGDVKGATSDYENAVDAAKKKDQDLFNQLTALGDTLTEGQKQEYIKAFQNHPDYKAAYEKKDAAAKKLAQALQKDPEALKNALATGTQSVADVRKALNLLAESKEGPLALTVANDLVKDPTSPAAKALLSGDPTFAEKLVEKALPKTAAEYLQGADDPKDGYSKFVEGMEKFKPLLELAGGYDQARFAAKQMKNAADYENYPDLKKFALQWQAKGPAFKGIAVASLFFAGASAGESWRNAGEKGSPQWESYAKAFKDLGSASKGGLDLAAQLTGAFTGFGAHAAPPGAAATRIAAAAANASPVLGLMTSSVSAGLRVHSIREDADAGKWVALGGDLLSAAGSMMELGAPLAGPAAPAVIVSGMLVGGVGAMTSAAGELWSNHLQAKEQQEQMQEFLEKAGVQDADLREVLSKTDEKQTSYLTEDLGLTAEQVQALATKTPMLVAPGHETHFDFKEFKRMLLDHGLKGESAYKVLDALLNKAEDPHGALAVLISGAAKDGSHIKRKEQWGIMLEQASATSDKKDRAAIDDLRKTLGYAV
ncbi:hypothetical protein HUA78_03455 [Myxococcus sp. CA033]|uniref:hypothetical protein n=1 Tax=Myxococcus sp. CA033 TaxID=2741516 RepID=UPI00157AC44A|nr:hypothetical protein [Myxococcus sp. CA033]NTX33486.1 hypothetical protein [Myxococcus sp. CA033]